MNGIKLYIMYTIFNKNHAGPRGGGIKYIFV